MMLVRAVCLAVLVAGFFGLDVAALTALTCNVSGSGAADFVKEFRASASHRAAGQNALTRRFPGPRSPSMKYVAALLTGFLLTASLAAAQAPSAEQLLSQAKAKAAAEQKAIFVHFGASWCGWCKRLDAFLERSDIKPIFEKYFIPVKLVVQESAKNKALENPGAEALLSRWGGPSGFPFSVFVDAQGALIINSKRNGQNIGYPFQADEIDWFVQMMKKAAPRMTDADLKTIETALKNPKKT